MRRTGRPLKALVNEALRMGLERRRRQPLDSFRVEAVDLGVRDGVDLDDVEGLMDQAEGVDRP
jgi:hypothetical protein